MTPSATQEPTKLAELEERARQAWGLYRENLVDLDGVAYDESEKAEWEHLQTELREIAAERSTVRAGAGESAAA